MSTEPVRESEHDPENVSTGAAALIRDRLDAARFRWLCEADTLTDAVIDAINDDGSALRAAVDAAMQKERSR